MPKDFNEYLLTKDTTFWLPRLRNMHSDWASNLLLYYVYNGNAQSLAVLYNTTEKWLSVKRIEIKSWQDFLISHFDDKNN
jgi:hypothetical protein